MKLSYVKMTFKTPWEEGESRFDIQKTFIPVCQRWEDSCMTVWRHWSKFCFQIFHSNQNFIPNVQLKWELLKCEIRNFTIDYSKNFAKEQK